MAGRKHVFSDVSTGHFTKDEIDIKKKAERKLEELERLQVTPPNHLKGEARKEWTRMYKLVQDLPIGNIDSRILEAYCESYETFRTMNLDIKERGHIIVDSRGNRVANPAVRIRDISIDKMRASLSDLGLTATERLKTAIEVTKEEEKKGFDLSQL